MYVGEQVQCYWFLYTGRLLQCIKGFAYRFSHDSHLDIDRKGLTAYCRSSSGDSIGFGTICTMYQCDCLVTDASRSWLMVAGFQSKALLALFEVETAPFMVPCGSEWLLCCLLVSMPQGSQFHYFL